MILNFEEYTVELNAEEIKHARQLAANLKFSVGKEEAVSANQIIKYFKKNYSVDLKNGSKVRKLIQYIRQNNLSGAPICATSKGYFVPKTEKEFDEYVTGLKQRLNSIAFTLKCFEKYK